MRIGVTLARKGNSWQVLALPGVDISKQLRDFKAAKIAGITCDEMIILSSSGILKRIVNKNPQPALESTPSFSSKSKSNQTKQP